MSINSKKKSKPTVVIAKTKAPQLFKIHGSRSKSKPTSSAVASTTNTEAEGEPAKKIVAKKKSDSVELHSSSPDGLTISLPSGTSRVMTGTTNSIACKSNGGETPEKPNKSPWGKKAINHANVHSSFDFGQEEAFYNDTCHSSNTSSRTSYHYSENTQSSSPRYSRYFQANREG